MSFHSTTIRYIERMKRGYRGLYGNRIIQYGNRISYAENKNRRKWKPNVQIKSVYSKTLDKMISFKMTTHVIRCIEKYKDGLDEYILRTKDNEIKYEKALLLKKYILERKDIEGTLPDIKTLRARFFRGCKKNMRETRKDTIGLALAKKIGVENASDTR